MHDSALFFPSLPYPPLQRESDPSNYVLQRASIFLGVNIIEILYTSEEVLEKRITMDFLPPSLPSLPPQSD